MKYKIVWQSRLDPSAKGEGSTFSNPVEQQTWATWANREVPHIRHWVEAVENDAVNKNDILKPERHPFVMFSLDWQSHYKSLWLGWWLVTWRVERWRWHFRVRELSVEFQRQL